MDQMRWPCRGRVTTLAALVVMLPWLGACQSDAPPATSDTQPAAPAVSIALPVKKQVVEWDEYTARIEAVEDVDVRARVSGYLETVAFDDGAVVEEGDLLFVIDRRPFEAELREREAQVAQAKAAAVNARTQFERAVRLREGKTISEEQFTLRKTASQAADADVQSSLAALEAARLNLEFTEVRAPISGRISRPFITEGNFVSGGTASADLLTRIVSLDPIHAYFEASERAYLKYVRLSKSGQRPSSRDVRNPVFVQLADEEGFPHRGYIDFVDNLLDPNTGTMTGRALLDNADGVLTPGLFARVRLPGSGIQEALLVPDAAIGSDQTQKYVVIVDDDDVASYRRVEIGSIVHGLRLIRSGLDDDDRVVIAGLQRAIPGQPVSPEPGEIVVEPEALAPEDAMPVRVAAD